MAALRALGYFVEEALVSLWRSRVMNALSIATITVSLFVLGAFLTLASNLGTVVDRWSRKAQVSFFLEDGLEARIRVSLADRLRGDAAVESLRYVSKQDALARFSELFRDLRSLPDDLGENPFPASLEVTLRRSERPADEARRLVAAYEKAPGVREVQYDLLWIERLSAGVRLVRGVGLLLGSLLAVAAVFTISNVLRLTAYARQDELDIMRLVGATRAWVRGPFVVEGVIQGALGGSLAVGLLFVAFRVFGQRTLEASALLERAVVFLPLELSLALVAVGALAGLAGSLVSLGRLRV